MRTRYPILCLAVGCMSLMSLVKPALAVIRVDVPLKQVYGSAQQILVAKVTLVDTGANVAELGEVVGLDELVERDGTLWQKDSPVYVRGKPIGKWEEQ